MTCSKCDKPILAGWAEFDGALVCVDCLITPEGKSKYRNHRTEYNGRTFDSAAEALRCQELDLLRRGGAIREYGCQPVFRIGCHENVYRADFLVTDDNFLTHVEDVKGVETSKFRRDRNLWKRYGKHPLVLLKRSGSAWEREIIWPVGVDRSKYPKDWSCAA